MAAFDPAHRSEQGSRGAVWAALFLICLLGSILSGCPWEPYTGILLALGGGLMILFPPEVKTPRLWGALGAVFVLASLSAFLPVSLVGGFPAWRQNLEALGVPTGNSIAIQKPQSLEMLGVFVATLIVALWLAGHRASPAQIRRWALAFSIGVAVYAILSELTRDWGFIDRPGGHFGFFPNRNHTGTYLAMGVVCGLGVLLQAVRDRRMPVVTAASLSIAVSIWAAVGWSISRGGVLLIGLGSILWLCSVGPRYLGTHGRRAVGLLLLAIIGGYLLADTQVKTRLAKTTDAAAAMLAQNEAEGQTPIEQSSESLDFRVPIAWDTMDLLRDFKGFGIGAGQFSYIIPQYRNRTIVANDNKILHPESDWLWMAAEAGVPATAALLLLVILVIWKSFREILSGRDRSIRLGCLIAASLVALHGFFDVPGHRIPLAWTSAFLFAISFRTPSDWRRSRPQPWLSRSLGSGVLAFGVWLAVGFWVPEVESTTGKALRINMDAKRLFEEAVTRKGDLVSGKVAELQSSIHLFDQVSGMVPLDYQCYGQAGRGRLFFPDQYKKAERDFQLERDLMPYWVKIPYSQGMHWASIDPKLSVGSWREMLRRADAVDLVNPKADLHARFLKNLSAIAKKYPVLQASLEEAQTPE